MTTHPSVYDSGTIINLVGLSSKPETCGIDLPPLVDKLMGTWLWNAEGWHRTCTRVQPQNDIILHHNGTIRSNHDTFNEFSDFNHGNPWVSMVGHGNGLKPMAKPMAIGCPQDSPWFIGVQSQAGRLVDVPWLFAKLSRTLGVGCYTRGLISLLCMQDTLIFVGLSLSLSDSLLLLRWSPMYIFEYFW